MNDPIIDRVARAMYGTMAHAYPWEQCSEQHKELFRCEARAAITEILALSTLRQTFPELGPVP